MSLATRVKRDSRRTTKGSGIPASLRTLTTALFLIPLTPAQVSITSGAGKTVAAGGSIQLTANAPVIWGLPSGPGTICATGLYIAPRNQLALAIATITATSQAQPTLPPTTTIEFVSAGTSSTVITCPPAPTGQIGPPGPAGPQGLSGPAGPPGAPLIVPPPVWNVTPPLAKQSDGSWSISGLSLPTNPAGGLAFAEDAAQILWKPAGAQTWGIYLNTVPPTFGITLSDDGTTITIDAATQSTSLPFAATDDVRVSYVWWQF